MRIAWPVAVILAAVGCGEDTVSLEWQYRFERPEDETAARVLVARILRDGCSGGEELWTTEIVLDGTGPAPMRPPALEPGTYGFALDARDDTCTRIARGCESQRVPTRGSDPVITTLLADMGASPDCPSEECSTGRCAPRDAGVIPDAGVDGSIPDAGPCEPGTADCNFDPADRCETRIDTLENCGGCGVRCLLGHAAESCTGGSCTLESCETGFQDCDSNPANGCETRMGTVANCGGCGTECSFAHASAECMGGSCQLGACHAGWADCDTNPANGCEQSLASPSHCGACNSLCDALAPLCGVDATGARACVISCVAPAPTQCGSSCFDTATDPRSCGTCDNVCSTANGVPDCTAGSCGLDRCNPGWLDCVAGTGGCETSAFDPDNCRSCGTSCAGPDAITSCGSGGCSIDECVPLRADCNGSVGDGCEASLTLSGNCGMCGVACSGATPVCGTRGSAEYSCLGSCSDPAPLRCGDQCVDGRYDEMNCGACDNVCSLPEVAVQACVSGSCVVGACPAGRGDCNADPADGCELDTTADTMNCGACNNVCPEATQSLPVCNAGHCDVSCFDGFGNCDGDPANGCEQMLNTTDHCGRCGGSCTPAFATGDCSTGTCVITSCNARRLDCDSSPANGCEIDGATDRNNCGGCGMRCTMGSCRDGACR